MKKFYILFWVVVFLNGPLALAEVRTFKELNFSVQIPNGNNWVEMAPPMEAIKLAFKKDDNTKSIGITIQMIPLGQKLDSQFMSDFEGNAYPTGKTNKFYSVETTIDGVSARKVSGEHLKPNGPSTKRGDVYFIANKLLYTITVMKTDGDPLEDKELNSFISSFKFLSTPPNK